MNDPVTRETSGPTVAQIRGAFEWQRQSFENVGGMIHPREHVDSCGRCGALIPQSVRTRHERWHARLIRDVVESGDVIVGRCPDDDCEEGLVRYVEENGTRVACDSCPWEGWDEEILGNPRTGQ